MPTHAHNDVFRRSRPRARDLCGPSVAFKPVARGLLIAVSAGLLGVGTVGGCAGQTGSRGTGDPITDITYGPMPQDRRVDAVDRAWEEVLAGQRDRAATRRVLKDIAWDVVNTPEPVRAAIVDRLMTDPDPEGLADSEALARLMLPTERSRAVTSVLATRSVENGWVSVTPALVRSLARPARGEVDDLGRVEAKAIQRLHPDREVVDVVFDVFLDPQTEEGSRELRLDERTRAAAWDLLGRLDSDGSRRAALLVDLPMDGLDAEARALVTDMRSSSEDLRTIPRTAAELRWLRSIRDKVRANDPVALRWWNESSRALQGLTDDQRRGLALRHVEVIRVATERMPEWFGLSRSEAVAKIEASLDPRDRSLRTSDNSGDNPRKTERVRDFRDQLVWADAVTIALLDSAARDAALVERIMTYADLDRQDTTTEYGGVLRATPGGGYELELFPPRERDRTSDTEFVASEDMIADSDFALAHLHFHVNRVDNSRYAGPSLGDLNYAALSGRHCVVLSSVSRDRLNMDYYQPDSVTIDLGEVTR